MKRMWSRNELKDIVKGTQKDITTLVGKNGNPRFIEGTIKNGEVEEITSPYNKWSLSGSHLMIVSCLNLPNALAITDNKYLADIELPQWVYDKITPIVGSTVAYGAFKAYASDYTSQDFPVRLDVYNGHLYINKEGALTLTKDRVVRINFDLLIDNE